MIPCIYNYEQIFSFSLPADVFLQHVSAYQCHHQGVQTKPKIRYIKTSYTKADCTCEVIICGKLCSYHHFVTDGVGELIDFAVMYLLTSNVQY
jgi:hypothetical protein